MQTLGCIILCLNLFTPIAKIYTQSIHTGLLIMVQSCQTKLHQSKAISGICPKLVSHKCLHFAFDCSVSSLHEIWTKLGAKVGNPTPYHIRSSQIITLLEY